MKRENIITQLMNKKNETTQIYEKYQKINRTLMNLIRKYFLFLCKKYNGYMQCSKIKLLIRPNFCQLLIISVYKILKFSFTRLILIQKSR